MNLNLQNRIVLVVIVALGFVGLLVWRQHSLTQSLNGSENHPIFQPEAQMLSQALDAAANLNTNSIPEPVDPNLTKYVYDKQTCASSASSPYLCLADYYKTVVANYGASIAFNDIKQRYKDNPLVVTQCHPLMHVIGRQAADKYKTVSEAYLHGDAFCWSGYYHGIMEGIVAHIGSANLPKEMNSICADIPGKATYNFDYYNCVHGIGHGIMELGGDEVFNSLSLCDNLTGDWEQQSCYGGVYMENIISNDYNHNSKYLKPDQPLYPCTAVETRYKYQCYLGQTSYALETSGYNFPKVFALCAAVEQPYRDICNQSMGRDAANQAYHDKNKTKETCSLGASASDVTNCVIGAVKEIISYYHAETQALDFCKVLDGTDREVCTRTADSYYSVFK